MTAVLFVATLVCIVANAFIAVADLVRAGFVVRNAAAVRVPATALSWLGSLKLAGAAGLVVGLAVAPWLGVAAGFGLTLFFVGAVVAHVRARVFSNIAFPGLYLLLAVAATACLLRRAVG
ncbi:DoxX family protein [Streptomyces sp. 3MP-14]|uniref:DoxX family protein n=1 Tax=Streptomyces mimosae TaxID=2586635 RepID=A0A5N6A1C7_9ACTN|nr:MULTISPECIES: DoxX family protein [Streptomyces]KAB8162564.1 DoxX family protein [Streptomyces mimosae]KAB8174391.1 DoxX family protein [Streptomyces sp. 3MP-14]